MIFLMSKNDHKKIGRELGLFSFSKKVSGTVFGGLKENFFLILLLMT